MTSRFVLYIATPFKMLLLWMLELLSYFYLLLVVYSKVFGPAIVALLLVFAGGQMVRDNRIIQGFLVMWSGNLAVLAMVLTHWLRLRKT